MNIARSLRSPLVFLVTLLAWAGLCADRATAHHTIEHTCNVTLPNTAVAFQHDYRVAGALGVIQVKWVTAGSPDPTWRGGIATAPVPMDHCYILSERTHATIGPGATYNPDGSIIALNTSPGIQHFPAVQTLRVPHCYGSNGYSALNIFVGGQSDHTGANLELAGLQFDSNGIVELGCHAFAFSRSYPTSPQPAPSDPPRPQMWWSGTMLMGQRTRDLLMHFGGANNQFDKQYGVGFSLGGSRGISLIREEVGHPFAVTANRAGAHGYWDDFLARRAICMTRSPQSQLLVPGSPPIDCANAALAGSIKLADPDYYYASILPILNSTGATTLINQYDPIALNRPPYVQGAVKKLSASYPGRHLQVRLIIVQGTADKNAYPHNAIRAWRKIMQSGDTSKARLYFLKDLNHLLTIPLSNNGGVSAFNHWAFVKAAVNWAENPTNPPGPLDIRFSVTDTTTSPAKHCTQLGIEQGFGDNPCKCWDHVVQPAEALKCSPGGVDKH